MPGKDLLLPRLAENEEILLQTNELLTEAVASNLRIAPASEWLLDNFYKIEEQIRMAKTASAERLQQRAAAYAQEGRWPGTRAFMTLPGS